MQHTQLQRKKKRSVGIKSEKESSWRNNRKREPEVVKIHCFKTLIHRRERKRCWRVWVSGCNVRVQWGRETGFFFSSLNLNSKKEREEKKQKLRAFFVFFFSSLRMDKKEKKKSANSTFLLLLFHSFGLCRLRQNGTNMETRLNNTTNATNYWF